MTEYHALEKTREMPTATSSPTRPESVSGFFAVPNAAAALLFCST